MKMSRQMSRLKNLYNIKMKFLHALLMNYQNFHTTKVYNNKFGAHTIIDDDASTYSFLSDDHSIHDPLQPKNIGAQHATTSALVRAQINKIGAPPRLYLFLSIISVLLFVVMVAMFGAVAGSLGNTGNMMLTNLEAFNTPYTVPLM
jgi:hypothetical protein